MSYAEACSVNTTRHTSAHLLQAGVDCRPEVSEHLHVVVVVAIKVGCVETLEPGFASAAIKIVPEINYDVTKV